MSSENFSLAAKSFIVNDNKLLIIRRSNYTVQKPGIWEIPGGRVPPEEDIIEGLKREAKEETGLNIEVIKPMNKRSFIREDAQNIDLTIFLCNALNKDVRLSREHTDFKWVDINNAKDFINEFFHQEVDIFLNQID